MERADLLRELAELNVAAGRCATNLFELEHDSRWLLVSAAVLQGDTAEQRAAIARSLPELWAGLCALNELLVRANALRDRKRRDPAADAELERLLHGAVIDMAIGERHLHERSLIESSRVHVVMTVWELVERMTSRFAHAASFVARVAESWNSTAPRLAAMERALNGCACVDGTAEQPSDHVAIRKTFDALASVAALDPLAVLWSSLDDAERSVMHHCRTAVEAHRLRTDLDRRTGGIGAEIAELQREVSRTRALVDRAAGRIAGFHCRLPDFDAERLEHTLVFVRRRAEMSSSMLEAAADLIAIESQLRATGDGLMACWIAAESAVRERDDLRARLDAYRVMAAERGSIESASFAAAFEAAQLELFGAPCDVVRAGVLVGAVRAVIDSPERLCERGAG